MTNIKPYAIVAVYITYLESFIVYKKTLVGHVMRLKAYNRPIREFWAVSFVKTACR